MASPLIEDENNDCRWQASIVVGEFIPSHPEIVWAVIAKHGVSDDADMRMAIGTILLEHLIEWSPAEFRGRAEGLAAQLINFADTLRVCWSFEE